ncbi:hypothetical protein ACUY22_12035, partial [Corynebacterium tuberculostearicum]
QLWGYCLARGLHRHIFRQDAVLYKTDHTILRILVKFSWHIPDFPIYSNGTKPGTLHSGLIKGPRRYSDHKVSKTVKFCIGETKRVSPFEPLEPKWSREFEWTISDSLKQRQYAEVTTNVDNLDLPSFKFRVNTRLREDVKWSSDKTAAELTSIVTKPGLKNASRAEYEIPKKSGTFFTEVDGIYLNIPSWGYEQSYDGYQFAIGRFECPQYSPNSNLCVFTNPVDDHTFD